MSKSLSKWDIEKKEILWKNGKSFPSGILLENEKIGGEELKTLMETVSAEASCS
jgi:hypothetical protein